MSMRVYEDVCLSIIQQWKCQKQVKYVPFKENSTCYRNNFRGGHSFVSQDQSLTTWQYIVDMFIYSDFTVLNTCPLYCLISYYRGGSKGMKHVYCKHT